MIYVITNGLWEDNKPHPKAYRGTIPQVHIRTCSEKYFNKNFSINEGKWKENGTKHQRINNTHWIGRVDGKKKVWLIEITTARQLANIAASNGGIEINCNDLNEQLVCGKKIFTIKVDTDNY